MKNQIPGLYKRQWGQRNGQSNASQRFGNEGFPSEDISREALYNEPQQGYTKPILQNYTDDPEPDLSEALSISEEGILEGDSQKWSKENEIN